MRAQDYIQVTYESLTSGKDISEVLMGLHATLERRGHRKLKRQILGGLLSYVEEKEKSTAPHVRVAREGDIKSLEKDINETLTTLDVTEEPNVSIDPRQIGGFTVTHAGKRIDRSYKSALLHLYKNITS